MRHNGVFCRKNHRVTRIRNRDGGHRILEKVYRHIDSQNANQRFFTSLVLAHDWNRIDGNGFMDKNTNKRFLPASGLRISRTLVPLLFLIICTRNQYGRIVHIPGKPHELTTLGLGPHSWLERDDHGYNLRNDIASVAQRL